MITIIENEILPDASTEVAAVVADTSTDSAAVTSDVVDSTITVAEPEAVTDLESDVPVSLIDRISKEDYAELTDDLNRKMAEKISGLIKIQKDKFLDKIREKN